MITGMIMPACERVASLNFLTNSPMFTPCWPSAGPTGGAGVAGPQRERLRRRGAAASGHRARADEVADARRLADEDPGLLVHHHLSEDVAWIGLHRAQALLSVPDLGDLLGRDHDFLDALLEAP